MSCAGGSEAPMGDGGDACLPTSSTASATDPPKTDVCSSEEQSRPEGCDDNNMCQAQQPDFYTVGEESVVTNHSETDDDTDASLPEQEYTMYNLEEETEAGVDCPSDAVKQKKEKNDLLLDTLKVLGAMNLSEMPVSDISHITISPDECILIGTILHLIGPLVVVQSLEDKPVYDSGTIMFLDSGKMPLGVVFDVIGSVKCPQYLVRFSDEAEATVGAISSGTNVYVALQSEHSHCVFLQKLLKEKGSDASGKNDVEVPKELQEASDDEAQPSCSRRPNDRKRNRSTSTSWYQRFEENMNIRNVINSQMHQVRRHAVPQARHRAHGAGASTHAPRAAAAASLVAHGSAANEGNASHAVGAVSYAAACAPYAAGGAPYAAGAAPHAAGAASYAAGGAPYTAGAATPAAGAWGFPHGFYPQHPPPLLPSYPPVTATPGVQYPYPPLTCSHSTPLRAPLFVAQATLPGGGPAPSHVYGSAVPVPHPIPNMQYYACPSAWTGGTTNGAFYDGRYN